MECALAVGMRVWWTAPVIVALLGCGKSAPRPEDSAASAPAVVSETPPIAATESSKSSTTSAKCPPTGRWARCSVEKRLTQSGFVVKPAEATPARRAGFSIAPSVYRLGSSHLEVFIYPDEKAMQGDLAGIDTLTASPAGSPTQWESTPTFVHSNNLAAVFLTDSRVRAERLTLALTAGAPQAARGPTVLKPVVATPTHSGQDRAPLPE